jgi:hypothetical protein
MASIIKVINRCLAVEFYRQNAAFFGLLFLIIFGFIRASEHVAIGSFLVANPATLLLLYAIWIAYEVKVLFFVIPATAKKENNFLSAFVLFTFRDKIKSIIPTTLALLLPIIAYAAFLITLALRHQFYLAIASLLLVFTVSAFGLSFLIFKRLNNIHVEKGFIQIPVFGKFARPSWLFFIEYLFRKEPVLLILSKAYSCLVIIGTSSLYHTDQYDLRLMATGILLSFTGNTSILHKFNWFNYHEMKFGLNLPLSFIKFYLAYYLTFTILLLPEFIVIFRYYPITLQIGDIAGLIFFGFGLCMVIYSMLLLKQLELSDFTVRVFWLIVISTFLILFSIHPLILGFLYILIAASIMYFWRFRFEIVEKAN